MSVQVSPTLHSASVSHSAGSPLGHEVAQVEPVAVAQQTMPLEQLAFDEHSSAMSLQPPFFTHDTVPAGFAPQQTSVAAAQ